MPSTRPARRDHARRLPLQTAHPRQDPVHDEGRPPSPRRSGRTARTRRRASPSDPFYHFLFKHRPNGILLHCRCRRAAHVLQPDVDRRQVRYCTEESVYVVALSGAPARARPRWPARPPPGSRRTLATRASGARGATRASSGPRSAPRAHGRPRRRDDGRASGGDAGHFPLRPRGGPQAASRRPARRSSTWASNGATMAGWRGRSCGRSRRSRTPTWRRTTSASCGAASPR